MIIDVALLSDLCENADVVTTPRQITVTGISNSTLMQMEILKKTGIDWCETRLISKLYMDQSVKVRLDQGVTKSVKIGRGVRQGCGLSPLLYNLYSEYITQEALEGLGGFKVGGQIISTMRYAYDFVLLAKEETIPQSIIDMLIEVRRGYGMEINVEKAKTEFQGNQPQCRLR
jgi:hypothetical protein